MGAQHQPKQKVARMVKVWNPSWAMKELGWL
jgi:hypothetical protein